MANLLCCLRPVHCEKQPLATELLQQRRSALQQQQQVELARANNRGHAFSIDNLTREEPASCDSKQEDATVAEILPVARCSLHRFKFWWDLIRFLLASHTKS